MFTLDSEVILGRDKNLPKLLEMLKEVEDTFEGNIYVGGGCLRDNIILGGSDKIKDYDIFVVPNVESEESIEDILRFSNFDIQIVTSSEYLSDMKDRGVFELIKTTTPEISKPVEFIVYKNNLTPEALASDFDFNICQVIMNTKGGCVCTENFIKGIQTRKIWQTKTYNESRMWERSQRLLNKFRGSYELTRDIIS